MSKSWKLVLTPGKAFVLIPGKAVLTPESTQYSSLGRHSTHPGKALVLILGKVLVLIIGECIAPIPGEV